MSAPTGIVAASTFPVDPPRGGGQLRLMHLCRALARTCPVEIIALTADRDDPRPVRELGPGLRERRVAKTEAHVRAELELEQQVGVPVTDIAFARLHALTPAFGEAIAAALSSGAWVLACHPYPLPAITAVAPVAPLLYDAQDVAIDLKTGMLRPTRVAEGLLETTRAVERGCCERAALVLPVSARDAERLSELYGVPAERLAVTPNGVDAGAVRFTPPSERRALRERLRLDRPQALFLASWHEPNLAAVRHILALAEQRPEVDFLLAGSACLPFADTELPGNVTMFGVVSDGLRDTLLALADVALNPMSSGSGSNIKMLDYLAAGAPVISTPVGLRGLDLGVDEVRSASLPEFSSAIEELLATPVPELDARARAGRMAVEQRFDWSVIGDALVSAVRRVAGATPE